FAAEIFNCPSINTTFEKDFDLKIVVVASRYNFFFVVTILFSTPFSNPFIKIQNLQLPSFYDEPLYFF
ncbi:MAG: hypothetical protein LBP87_01930, partial [Planctomycetaceae bacterium]|nr:hypothetical protein [Planctomycetaceae bacterium]